MSHTFHVPADHVTLSRVLVRVQEKKLSSEVTSLELDTGVHVRVLAQNYPETPGEGGVVGGGS